MVEFIKNKESGTEYMELFCIARDPETAFYMWKKAKELDLDVCINNKMYGNDWEARVAIEEHFKTLYRI